MDAPKIVYVVSKDEDDYEFDRHDVLFFLNRVDANNFLRNNNEYHYRPDIVNNIVDLSDIQAEAYNIDKDDIFDQKLFENKYNHKYAIYLIEHEDGRVKVEVGLINFFEWRNKEEVQTNFARFIQVCSIKHGGCLQFGFTKEPSYYDVKEIFDDTYFVMQVRKKKKENKVDFIDYIYFITDENSKCVKIGLTRNVEKRIKQLQTSSPYKLTLIKKIKGGYEKEAELHKKFKMYRLSGEWFTLNDEILEYIKRVK